MNDNKYYQPEPSELRIGFEYEYQDFDGKDVIWVKKTISFDEQGYWELPDNFCERVRVKFLDSEDIAKAGFSNNITKGYQKPSLIVCETTEPMQYYKLVYSLNDHSCTIEDVEMTLFVGHILNSNELSFIMNRLNIKK